MALQGLVWNYRGLKKKGVSTFLKDLIPEQQFHFVGLPETMIANCDYKLLRKFDPHQEFLWMWNPSKGKSSGILVGVKMELYDVGSFKQGDYMLQLNLGDKTNRIK